MTKLETQSLTQIEPEALTIFILLDKEVQSARLQYERITEDSAIINILFPLIQYHERIQIAMVTLFADINFLFMCLTKVEFLSRKLQQTSSSNDELLSVLKRHERTFLKWNNFSDHLENINERIKR